MLEFMIMFVSILNFETLSSNSAASLVQKKMAKYLHDLVSDSTLSQMLSIVFLWAWLAVAPFSYELCVAYYWTKKWNPKQKSSEYSVKMTNHRCEFCSVLAQLVKMWICLV